MTDALQWLRDAVSYENDDHGDWFMDNLGYGNAGSEDIGELYETPDGLFTFELEDAYFRRIEDEPTWLILRPLGTEQFYKLSAKFTSWDSLDYKVEPTQKTTVTTSVWS